MTNAGKTGVGLCLSLLADAFSGDDEDDDEGVMCWRNGSMFFPLCFLASSLFSWGLLLRCTAGGEETTGDGNEGTKAMARACWLVLLCFLLFIFFPSARPCCVLPRPFVLWFSFPCFPSCLY